MFHHTIVETSRMDKGVNQVASVTVDTDVLIVGAGVAGLTAAALLAREGTSAITISRYPSTANAPRAHLINQRTLEVLRDLGIESDVYRAGQFITDVPATTFVESLAGREFARRYTWGARTDRLAEVVAASPTRSVNLGQHLLEPIINRRAVELGADIRFSNELEEIAQDESGVSAIVRYTCTGERYRVNARYVIGADGGRSRTAEQLGFKFAGETNLGYALNAWFEADLSKYVSHRPGVLYFTNHPGREYLYGSGTFLLVKPFNEWVIQFSYDPATEDLDAREDVIIRRIHHAIGDESVPIKMKAMSKWQINRLVAKQYRIGRAFLAGDAAHRHSPGGGLGANTSIQDSYNLAWKIAAVVRGHAGPALLDTYDEERRPVGEQVVDQATRAVGMAAEITRRLGIRAGQSEQEGRDQLDAMFATTPDGEARRAELNRALDAMESIWNAQGIELGQRYKSDAVLDDGSSWPADKDPSQFYQPTTHPGAHLPHVWLERRGTQISTVDLVGRGNWALITGLGGDGWAEAAKSVGEELGIDIVTSFIGPGLEFADPLAQWAAVREIGDRGCLLVRPDGHIAWRVPVPVSDPVGALRTALQTILART